MVKLPGDLEDLQDSEVLRNTRKRKSNSILRVGVLTCGIFLLGWLLFYASSVTQFVLPSDWLLEMRFSSCGGGRGGGASGDGMFNSEFVTSSRCSKIAAVSPKFNKSIGTIFNDADFKSDAVLKLRGAVQIPTVIEDNYPPPSEDLEYYSEFFKLHKYLEEQFPLVHSSLKLEKVNKVGLLYTWNGSEPDLKPLLLTAHQDVVPVNPTTIDEWEYPPFDAFYDEKRDIIWGRGVLDDKYLLIAELIAVEQLLKDGFTPRRTLLIGFGFDEEVGGIQGAKEISKAVYERYGDDGIYALLDEGYGVRALNEHLYIAPILVSEKGYVDLEVKIHGHGGHSSAPPVHTTIGVASELISLIEDKVFPYHFNEGNPLNSMLECVAEHTDSMPYNVRRALLSTHRSRIDDMVITSYLSHNPLYSPMIRTTKAVDVIKGGVKANALPESTTFIVNHRVEITSSIDAVIEDDLVLVKRVARRHGYGITLEGKEIWPATPIGYIEVTPLNRLDPSPISPTSGSTWDVFAGTLQDVYESNVLVDKDIDFYVTGSLFSANTDSKFYWNSTKNIYRMSAAVYTPDMMEKIHSVNEYIHGSSLLNTIGFVYEYVVNVNEQFKDS
ncbi:Gly-Xaa carboxypeptidase Ecym_8112 [Eremothecium cymbalariae DBVPG|uniref:Peptidase M20 dimerisation domain-containing protein n=1 Tax=Eremothecium cymbalariae (strain CBS 270.75 / DBVPG 7215 / KCTC 17166 / NRRL Y-17582) TaxID=931890 RepID=G8JX32_ERECY|nr:Hypothetical protein Ecym_8112 [Eremothecium cymbalariae DBVPG\